MEDRLILKILQVRDIDYFSDIYPLGKSLLFSLSLRDDIFKEYEEQASTLADVNPFYVLELLSFAGSYRLLCEYYQNFGLSGIPIYRSHAEEQPWNRRKNNFRFSLDFRRQLLERRRPEEIRIDLGRKIDKQIEENEDVIQLMAKNDNMSYIYEEYEKMARAII